MNPRDLNRDALVTLTTDCATGVANGKVTGLLAVQNTSISDALTDANAILAAANLNAQEARSASLAATELAVMAQETVLKLISELRFTMRGVDATADQYDALGLDAPDTTRSIVNPHTPTYLNAIRYSDHTNQLTWRGNNPKGSVVYVIEAKIGDTAPFVMIGTCSAQKFKHVNVTPGEYYEYRCFAQSARGVRSEYSNVFVIYGI